MSAADVVKKLVAAILTGEPAKPRRKWRAKRNRRPGGPGSFRVDPGRSIFEQVRERMGR